MFHDWLNMTYVEGNNVPKKGSEQYKQLRFAFVSGAASMLMQMIVLTQQKVDPAVGANYVHRYKEEITGFLNSELAEHKAQKGEG